MEQYFLDSSFIIAYIREKDEMYGRAGELRNKYRDNGSFFITDHILSEVVTFLTKRDGKETAYKIGFGLLKSEIKILFPEEKDLEQTLEILKKYDKLSFCDALNLVIMERHKINKIFSFDSDFDHFKKIERIY